MTDGMTHGQPPTAAEDEDRAEHAPRVARGLLEYLVCPVTRGPLIYDAERQELISRGAHLAFPIHGGIPVMLTDEARRLED